MYLRETRRQNKDGTVVRYLQLAHNERHPTSGVSTAKVIHTFGRAEQVDRQALARLVASISRVLDPAEEALAGAAGEVSVLDSRPAGGAWALGELWRALGIGAAIGRVARGRGAWARSWSGRSSRWWPTGRSTRSPSSPPRAG